MVRSTATRVLASLALLGIVVTLIAGEVADHRAETARTAALQGAADVIAEKVAAAMDNAVDRSIVLADFTEGNQLTESEYRVTWGTSSSEFPGESTADVVALVDPQRLDDFVVAMQDVAPGYQTLFVMDTPPPLGHLLFVLNSADSPYAGADLSVVPPVANALLAMEPDDTTVDGTNAQEIENPVGWLRVVHRHTLLGPDGIERPAWTMVTVDLEAVVSPIVANAGAGFGATIKTNLTGDVGQYGIAPTVGGQSLSSSTQIKTLDVTVTAWSDGSEGSATSRETVWVIGFLTTLGLTLIAGVGLVILALLDRVGRSDRDARQDTLTALPNRRWLHEKLEANQDEGLAILFCDLDRFKVVNDSAGHAVGDELLVQAAERLQVAVGDSGTVCRYGGDEFIIVCTAADVAGLGEDVADRVIHVVSEPFDLSSGAVRLSISIGIARTRFADGVSPGELIREADVALGKCKAQSRGGFLVYDESLKDAERDRLVLEADLQRSLDDGDFVVHFQPIVAVDGETKSFEALVRWERNGKLTSPGVFLPIVSEVGRMVDLGRIVLDQALETFAAAIRDQPSSNDLTLHVNVDGAQLTDEEFPAFVEALLTSHGVAPERLIIELTEDEWLDAMDEIGPVLEAISGLGVGLAIDDFGSGYSSPARLLSIEGITEIKFDRSMIQSNVDDRTAEFLAGLTEGIHRLGITVIAEGIETLDNLHWARKAGITSFQGYLFSRPGPADTVGLRPIEHSPSIERATG